MKWNKVSFAVRLVSGDSGIVEGYRLMSGDAEKGLVVHPRLNIDPVQGWAVSHWQGASVSIRKMTSRAKAARYLEVVASESVKWGIDVTASAEEFKDSCLAVHPEKKTSFFSDVMLPASEGREVQT